MIARNGKPAITNEKIRIVKEAVKSGSIREAAQKARVAYSTAWRIINGNPVRKVNPEYFEHDSYYSF